MTEGYLWTGQYPEAKRIIEKGNNQSMELDENLIDAKWTKNTNGEPQFFIINEAIISKLCILGEDVEPCFEGAQITKVQFSFEDDFKQQLFSMIEQMKEILNEGGTLMGDNNTIEASVINAEDTTTVEETPVVDNEPVIENPTSIEEGETPETDFSKKEDEDEGEEVCPKCGKVKSECHCDEKIEDKKEKYNLDEIQEYVELSTKYSELETKYNNLESDYNLIKTENEKLIEFKKSVEKKEKQNMIDSFWMLSEEDKKDVQEKIDVYSLDDIEGKLSIICVRNKVSFDLEEDKKEQTNPIAYNLNEVNDENTPAWIKAVKAVAKGK